MTTKELNEEIDWLSRWLSLYLKILGLNLSAQITLLKMVFSFFKELKK